MLLTHFNSYETQVGADVREEEAKGRLGSWPIHINKDLNRMGESK